jgi:2-oxo-4-hydroxy-4-carboxy-5-ureidoimidazoline decarboxylase
MIPLPGLAGRPVEARDRARFLAAYGHLFEHSPWVVERAWTLRPFADARALHEAFVGVVDNASPDERVALVCAHPELADKAAMAEGLTEASAREQASAGLDRLTPEEYAEFHALNRAYREKFGFPFIICVRLHDKAGVLAAMRERLLGDAGSEMAQALVQIGLIVRLRLAEVPVEAQP